MLKKSVAHNVLLLNAQLKRHTALARIKQFALSAGIRSWGVNVIKNYIWGEHGDAY